MTVSTASPPAEFMVACAKDYPRCMQSGFANGTSYAVKASECACHVAREATMHLMPKITVKESA